jgi:hypothetical protein
MKPIYDKRFIDRPEKLERRKARRDKSQRFQLAA